MLAKAVETGSDEPAERRYMAALEEWGSHGLSSDEVRQLLRKHGFSAQADGGWARGDWIETKPDGLRYLTRRSMEWIAAQRKQR